MVFERNRFLTAARIHDGAGWLPEGTVIEIAPDGAIVALHTGYTGDAEHFPGVLAPGFVNVHCHLELSHMAGILPEATGLIPFLQQVPAQRNQFTEEQKKAARHAAYQELLANGVVAVGDIANSNETLDIRLSGQLHIHTFVECIGFSQAFAQARLDYSVQVFNAFAAQQTSAYSLRQSIIPHAPYSVSNTLFQLIDRVAPNSLLSIHNQESEAEAAFYQQKTGQVIDLLEGMGIDHGFFEPSGKSSLQTYLPWLSDTHPVILVHNTFTTPEDVQFVQSSGRQVSWCLCPNANWYIERQLPDVTMLAAHTKDICIGTDSLASNHHLSVLGELHILKEHFPALSWETLLRWGTYNGARALQMEDTIGMIAAGKRPGILQLTGLEEQPTVQRII